MTFVLSVDLGTTFTAAAVCEPGGEPSMLSLGSSSYAVPSVLFLREDGTFLAGEAADLRSSSDPRRVARYFKRRLGDEVPIRLAGTPFAPQVLVTRLLEWVIQQATERQGTRPSTVVLTHPANWGPYRRELLQQVAAMASSSRSILLTEPEAAAIHYVASERVEPGELLAVYDLGGGTFDAVVMQRTATGFEAVGSPAGVERLGGMDFDDVIQSFVLEAAGLDEIERTDDAITAAYALQASCIDAKRVLSADTVADVRVVFPGVTTSVRVTRSEFEDRIRPRLIETLIALEAAIDSAGVQPEDLSRILLVGGSSRIPLVSALLAQRFGRPLAMDIDPKNTVALGAARFAASIDLTTAPLAAPPEPPSRRALSIPSPITSPTPPSVAVPVPAPSPAAAVASAPNLPSPPTAPRPSTPPATVGMPQPPAAAAEPAGELFSVRAESGHRTRLPPPSSTPTILPESEPAETEAVGLDPKLIGVGAILLVLVVAALAFALLR